METKICSKCCITKNVSNFGKDSTRKGGLSYLCKECLIKKSENYRNRNKEKVLTYYSEYRKNNKDKMKISRKKYISENKEKISKYGKYYSDKRRKESHLVRVSENIRRRVNHIFNNKKINKKNKTFEILGCSIDELLTHLEKQFKNGMTWDNHGMCGWHIDHIIPLSSAKTEEEIYKLCHYTNLQPLWAEENLKKGNKVLIKFKTIRADYVPVIL